jgi:hypothetical protein
MNRCRKSSHVLDSGKDPPFDMGLLIAILARGHSFKSKIANAADQEHAGPD